MKITNKKIYALLLCMVLLLTSVIPVSAAANTAKLSKTNITIGVKQSYTLKLSNNKKKIKWSSSKNSVATVNSAGKVTGKKKGTAVITAAVGKAKYRCKVTVKKPVLSKTKITLNAKKSYTLKLLYNKSKVKWSSDKKSVATVSSKGKVAAKKKGTAVITAAVGKTKYRCKVTVKSQQIPVNDTSDTDVEKKTISVCNQCGFYTTDVNLMDMHSLYEAHSCSSYDPPHTHEWENTVITFSHPPVWHSENSAVNANKLEEKGWKEEDVHHFSCHCGCSITTLNAAKQHMLETDHIVWAYIFKTVTDQEGWTETKAVRKCRYCGAVKGNTHYEYNRIINYNNERRFFLL